MRDWFASLHVGIDVVFIHSIPESVDVRRTEDNAPSTSSERTSIPSYVFRTGGSLIVLSTYLVHVANGYGSGTGVYLRGTRYLDGKSGWGLH